jgi:hypothetical protein
VAGRPTAGTKRWVATATMRALRIQAELVFARVDTVP